MEAVKTKKLNLKKASYAHIMADGSIQIFYSERHKTSGKIISWNEEVKKENLPFKLYLRNASDYKFKSVYISERAIPFLNELISVELWPNNQPKEASHALVSVIFNLKNKASISYDQYTINGKRYGGFDVAITF